MHTHIHIITASNEIVNVYKVIKYIDEMLKKDTLENKSNVNDKQ